MKITKKDIKISGLQLENDDLRRIIAQDKTCLDNYEERTAKQLILIDNLNMELSLYKAACVKYQKDRDVQAKQILTLANSCNTFNARLDDVIGYIRDMKC